MVGVKEEAFMKKLRVYNWNERLRRFVGGPCRLSDTDGLLLFDISDSFTTRILGEGVVDSTQTKTQKLLSYDHRHLLSRDSTEILLRNAVSATDQFLPETVQALAAEISGCLLCLYQFSPNRLHQPVSPRIVIVVEVLRSRSVEYCSREEMMGNLNLFPPWKPRSNIRFDWPFDQWHLHIDPAQYKNDPLFSYSSEILVLLDDLTMLLGVRNAFPSWPITDDYPLGFVEVLPVEFSLETFQQAVDGSCAICLQRLSSPGEEVELARTPCAHIFHIRCIARWLLKNPSCPLCRRRTRME